MAMFHCTDKKIALKDNLADYINIKNGIRMNPVLYLDLKLYNKPVSPQEPTDLFITLYYLSHHTRDVILSPPLSLLTASL